MSDNIVKEQGEFHKEVSELIEIIENIWLSIKAREAAADKLVNIGGELAIKALSLLAKNKEIAVRALAYASLRNMVTQLPEGKVKFLERASKKYDRDLKTIKQQTKPLNSALKSAEIWGKKNGYPLYEKYPQYEKIHMIGEKINQIGGHSGMWIPYNNILENNRMAASFLEGMWHGIGTWQR